MSNEIDFNYAEIPGGVCAPAGFQAGAVHCGVIPDPKEREDLSLIFSTVPCSAAAVFTTNKVKAAPVLVDMEHVKHPSARAILGNSRNANACTGAEGLEHARRMATRTAEALEIDPREVFVCSTGHIGHALPIEKIEAGITALAPMLEASPEGSAKAARGIMTSDDYAKETAIEVDLGEGAKVRIGAIAKGAGMICPNMATMLCFITTDARVGKDALQCALGKAVELSFNRITVDGDTSTNDTVLLLASGLAEAPALDPESAGWDAFCDALTQVCWKLARLMVEDGEGSSKTVDLRVRGALSDEDARKAARAVAKSQLVKASWCGGDPNWGRLMDALGYSEADFDPDLVDIYYEDVQAVKAGLSAHADMKVLYEIAGRKCFPITIDLNQGCGEYYIYAADLTAEYVKFNLRE